MASDLDIWRAANLLIEQHGEEAERIAVQRIEAMNERNDLDGVSTWTRIRLAVAQLKARATGPVH